MAEVTLMVVFVVKLSHPEGYIQEGGERSSYLWETACERKKTMAQDRKYVLIDEHGGHWIPVF